MLNKNCPGNESLTIALTDLRYFSMRSITDQNNDVITDGPGTTAVLHICDHKI